jgi:hypothetical protein
MSGLTQDQIGSKYAVSGPAILYWVEAKIPEGHQGKLQLARDKRVGKEGADLSQVMDRDRLREATLAEPSSPAGLKSFVRDDDVWLIYGPTGLELNTLREWAQATRDGKKSQWREALRALREFRDSEP